MLHNTITLPHLPSSIWHLPVQAPPRPPLRGGHPLPRRVPRPGHRGRGAELLHGEGGQQQQPGRDRQRARTAGRAGLGEDTNMRPEYLFPQNIY